MKVVAAIVLKWHMTGTDIFHIILEKFSHQKERVLIILLEIEKNVEIDLNYTILSLYQTINLQVKSSW